MIDSILSFFSFVGIGATLFVIGLIASEAQRTWGKEQRWVESDWKQVETPDGSYDSSRVVVSGSNLQPWWLLRLKFRRAMRKAGRGDELSE